MRVTAQLLKTFSCLRELPDETLTELGGHCSVHKFARRAVVLNAGKQEEAVCFLFEGRLQGVDFTIDGREVGLYFVEPGDFCGELGMFDGGTQPEYVIARSTSTAIFVPMLRLQAVSRLHAGITHALAARLAARVRQMARQRSLLGLPNIGQRVCCQLWMLCPLKAREVNPPATEILNPPTHMELAIMLNLSREAVSRVFQVLQTNGVVSRDGPGCLRVDKFLLLKDYAEGRERL